MKNLITLGALLFCFQISFANSIEIEPSITVDTFPLSKITGGIYGGISSNGILSTAYQLGLSSEYSFTPRFATEVEMAAEYDRLDYTFFGFGKANQLNIDLAVNAKLYFGKQNAWYGKVGFTANKNLNTFSADDPSNQRFYERGLTPGIQLGFGYIHQLEKGAIRFEPAIRYTGGALQGRFKIAYQF